MRVVGWIGNVLDALVFMVALCWVPLGTILIPAFIESGNPKMCITVSVAALYVAWELVIVNATCLESLHNV